MAEQSKVREKRSDDIDGRTSELAAFDREIEQYALQGHWKMELPANLEPRSKLRPMHWKGSLIREQLLRAGELIGVNEAGRRTIQLLNPGEVLPTLCRCRFNWCCPAKLPRRTGTRWPLCDS